MKWTQDSYMSIPADRENDADLILIDAVEELWKLRAFKEYVHKRLDDAGVPADPEPAKNAEHGCRIEGRLNYILDERSQNTLYGAHKRCKTCGAVEGSPCIERMHT